MPSLDRPNVQNSLPNADLENSVFRAWALRGSEGSNASEKWQPASGASSTSSHISPDTQLPNRKIKSADRRKNLSDSNTSSRSPPLRESLTQHIAPSYPPSRVIREEHLPIHKGASISSTVSNGRSSSRSSISLRAKNLFELSGFRVAPNAINDSQPHEAQKGFKWKHETSGHWLEVRIGKKRVKESSGPDPRGKNPLAQAYDVGIPSAFDHQNSVDVMKSLSLPSPTPLTILGDNSPLLTETAFLNGSADPSLSPYYPKEGLYCRTKRALGLKHGPIAGVERFQPLPGRAMTGEVGAVLERASSALRHFKNKGRPPASSATSVSNLSIAAPGAAIRWQHLRTGLSSSTRSSSSSLRSLMRGKPSPSTPEPESMYIGSDQNKYIAVQLTDPNAPTFLPSEARRIQTPPLGTPQKGSRKLRGFFFDYNKPGDDETQYSMNSDSTMPVSMGLESKSDDARSFTPMLARNLQNPPDTPRKLSEREWHRVKMNDIEGDHGHSGTQFTLDIPEHLPNSPLCPRHPKNKSGGKGACVYHGRNVSRGSPVNSFSSSQRSSTAVSS